MTRGTFHLSWAQGAVLVVFVAAALTLAAATGGPVTGETTAFFGPWGAQVSCSSGTPTFQAWPPCPDGAKTTFKNLLIMSFQDFKDTSGAIIPELSGTRATFFSGRLDPDGSGKISGSFEIVLPHSGGTWKGTLTGVTTGWFQPLIGTASARGLDGLAKGGRLSFEFNQNPFPDYPDADPNGAAPAPPESSSGTFQIK